jgi:choline dehydrogenase-like flavoprotein
MSAKPLGNTALSNFDAIVVGSGAGGAPVAEMLCRLGQKVLILEAGPNYFENLDAPDFSRVTTQFSNDTVKLTRRWLIQPDPLSDPRTFRPDASKARTFVGEVQGIPKTVGGGTVHADMKTPRFHIQDFRMRSLMGDIPGASFADWPLQYDELEKFYGYMERVLGVQGIENMSPWDPPRARLIRWLPESRCTWEIFSAEPRRSSATIPSPTRARSRRRFTTGALRATTAASARASAA